MNMTAIHCFLKVVEFMSFTKAADALYVSQQAVSIQIKYLENSYHVKLFERKPSLKLTESGELLYEAALEIIERENKLLNQFTVSQKEFRGEISIGLPPNRSMAFANGFIPLFSDKYPNMTVNLIEKTSTYLPASLKYNEIDLALPLLSQDSEAIDSRLFEILQLETEDLYVVISDDILKKYFKDQYPGCKTDFLSGVALKDIGNIPMFLHPSSSHMHETIVSYLVQNGTTPFIRVKTSLTSSLVTLCAKGYGIFFTSPLLLRYLYSEYPTHFQILNIFPINDFRRKRKTMLIYHKKKLLTKPLQDSVSIIQQIYKQPSSVNDLMSGPLM